VTGWRLPGGQMPYGSNITASEMGNLFYNVLGFEICCSIETTHNENYGLVKNVQSGGYWAGREAHPLFAWPFPFANGYQLFRKSVTLSAWAVHDGDVGASPVPVPGALVLMGPALLGLLGVKRSRRQGR